MYPFFYASFMTGVVYLLDLQSKCKRPFYKYIALFFLLMGINFLFASSKAHAEHLENLRIDNKLQQAKYHWEMEEHYRFTGKYVQDLLNAEKK